MGTFIRQFWALFRKNWIVLAKHPFLNLLRCFILPVAYGVFLAVAQTFLIKPNNYGIGSPVPVHTLKSQFDGSLSLIWTDETNGTGVFSAEAVMARVTSGFTDHQLNAVKKVDSAADIPIACPQNFNLFSECFAGIVFSSFPTASNASQPVDYTIRGDGGLFHIDVVRHTSDFEDRIMPLQWAVDAAIIDLTTHTQPPTPLEWPFTIETNADQSRSIRLSYIRGLRTLLVLALFIGFIGIAYQLPGAFSGERANLLTSHLKVMGLMDSARIISWHISISLAYLPAWIIVAVVWHFQIFTATNGGLVLVVHLLLGLSLASWSFFIAAPFGKSPQLAAIVTTFLAIIFAIIALILGEATTGVAVIFSLVFPPGYYIFAIRAMCGFENHLMPTNILHGDPDRGLTLLPLLIVAIIDIFLWPYLAVLLERRLYDAREPSTRSWRFWSRKKDNAGDAPPLPSDTAISIRNLGKTWSTSTFGRGKGLVTAISDLTLDIPKSGIFVLLGSNGAGKSTTLSIIAGLIGRSRGSITFEGGTARPARGELGIVPQKNVLFPELTCYQTLRVWAAIKHVDSTAPADDIEQLLRDCDLGKKIHANADTLSGGQKRKLQLAAGLIGGSKIILVDECTSGVDPLSRRALWRALNSVRHDRTIIFTTHFLDEADLLADHIAILAAPGKLVASGSPVSLKSTLGDGYSVSVSFSPRDDVEKESQGPPPDLLRAIHTLAPLTTVATVSPQEYVYHLRSKDSAMVQRVLQLLDDERAAYNILSYDVLGTSIEDIFLDLMDHEAKETEEKKLSVHSSSTSLELKVPSTLALTNGRPRSPLSQALTIFHKRALIAKRSWLTPLLLVLVAVVGSCAPLFFLSDRPQSCVVTFQTATPIPLYLPSSSIALSLSGPSADVLTSPPGLVANSLGAVAAGLQTRNIADNATFVRTIQQTYRDFELGGISMDDAGNSLLAWEGTPPGINGPAMLNLVSNILYNRGLNSSGQASGTPRLIKANYETLPRQDAGTLLSLKWVAFFAAAMAVFPAFFSLYVSRERRSSVQAMQLSNGLTDPIGLWLGHLMFDTVFSLLVASLIVIIWAAASNQFHGLGFFWVVLVLYGIVGALFSYCVSLFTSSPLAAFATSAGYQIIMFLLYLSGYLLTLTYAKTSEADGIITTIHFTMSILSPIASVLRASFVSVNLFSLLCSGTTAVDASSMGVLIRYGRPILYLIVYAFFLLAVLVWVDSGTIFPRSLTATRKSQKATPESGANSGSERPDVAAETQAVATSDDLLRVLHISKAYGGNKVVDDVSIGVSRDTVFANLGPNGAGKSTSFNIIRGDVIPDAGDVMIDGVSVVHHPRTARLSLGVCPQFTAIDSQLTVRQHLLIYGRLKGLKRGPEISASIEALLEATALSTYADRLASKLSGGNQRKLALAIALIGNPSVILIDEFSTGIDAKMKRDMWGTLRKVAVGKAVVITTHSMEEASALANKVGIMAKRLLAVGTTQNLVDRYAKYEVHFSCRTRADVLKALELMSRVPGARQADDVATRFEVPIERDGMSLAQLFHLLSTEGDFLEYTVEKASLESVFLKVIRENNVLEEDSERARRPRRWWIF
ncbi:hypothetical protein PLICRDRAFT_132803 [Plicaturopsis crispa FD-325 SS-3]|nr:hypothetical protein PLICRDRAFT_132803 [Plicaturopsis crispa FD-325 SS-3]